MLISTGTGINTGAFSLTTWSSTQCGIRIGASNINYNGTNHNFNGFCSFTNTTTPIITQAISLADNSTKIATTAYVQGQGYALLAGTQTFTGTNTFSNNINLNATAFYNNSTDARFVSSTSESTQMYQTSGGFTITSISN